MSKDEMIELKSLVIDLSKEGEINLLSHTLLELKEKGYSQIKLNIKADPEIELKNSKLDIQVLNGIKETQDLPEWVVINLMYAAGKLKESDFKNRFINE